MYGIMMRFLLCIALLALLTACGTPASARGLSVQTSPSATPVRIPTLEAMPDATPAATDTPAVVAPDEALVVYLRSGGMTGKTTAYTILGDGRVVVGPPRHTRPGVAPTNDQQVIDVPGGAAAAEALRAKITASQIDQLAAGDYAPRNSCCDRYAYEITLLLNGQHLTYSTVDGATTPAELSAVLDLVQQYLEAIQP